MQDLSLPCDTAEEVLALFDVKQTGKASFQDFKYSLAMLHFHIVKRDLISFFQYLDSFTKDGSLDLQDFSLKWF